MKREPSIHFWLPDRRSLCDQAPRAVGKAVEFNDGYPTCQACALVVDHLITSFGTILLENGDPAFSPIEALMTLQETRWGDFSANLRRTTELAVTRGRYVLAASNFRATPQAQDDSDEQEG